MAQQRQSRKSQVFFAVGVSIGALALSLLLRPLIEPIPFLFFFAAVALSAWYGGFQSAIITLILSLFMADYFLLVPYNLFSFAPADTARLMLFILIALLIGLLVEAQQRAARATTRQNEWFRTTFASIADGVIVTDASGRVSSLNPAAEELTGWKETEAIGKQVADILPITHEQTGQPILNPVSRVLKTNHIVNLENHALLTRRDGRMVAIEESASPISNQAGALLGTALIFRDITEHKQKQRLQAYLAAIVESSDDAIISKDLNAIITSWNKGAERMYGYSAEETIGKPISILIPPGFENDVQTILAHVKRGERVEHYETKRMCKDGRVLDVALTVSPIYDEYGQIVGASKIARDITERAHRSRLQSHLAAIVESSHDAIIGKDLNAIITSWNKGAERMYGYTAEEMIGKPVSTLVPPDWRDDVPDILARIKRGERVEHYETKRMCKDGRVLDVALTVSPIYDEAGRIIGASKIARDITEQKQIETTLRKNEEELRRSQEQLLDFMENAPLGMHWVGPDGIILWANRTELEMLGYTRDEYVGHHISNFHADANAIEDILKRLSNGESLCDYEAPLLCKDGSLRYGLISSNVAWEGDTFLHTRCFTRDITERKLAQQDRDRAEEALRKLNDELEQRVIDRTAALAAANQELESFSYSISHDLRTPLRSINGFSRILLEDCAALLPDDAKTYLETIAKSATHMGLLIDHLLQFSRLNRQPLACRSLDPATIARDAFEDLKSESRSEHIDLVIESLPPCLADPVLLKQVFVNLLSNAIKFTREQPNARIEVGYTEENNERIYFVKDNGIGFDMQYAGKLFGVFQRLHRPDEYEGTGIGLALVQRIIRRHNGRIWATGELNKGATFYFTLGALTPAPAAASQ